jgi:hypothetical protein
MFNPSPGWREAVIAALQRTLDCEYSAGQVPQALQAVLRRMWGLSWRSTF